MLSISNVGLWLILEKTEHLLIDKQNKVDLGSLDMLILENRIDQWKKEVWSATNFSLLIMFEMNKLIVENGRSLKVCPRQCDKNFLDEVYKNETQEFSILEYKSY